MFVNIKEEDFKQFSPFLFLVHLFNNIINIILI